MLLHTRHHLTEHDTTPLDVFQRIRRRMLGSGAALIAAPALAAKPEVVSSLEAVSAYNNYYEFSVDKQAIKVLAQSLTTAPWPLRIEGEVERPFSLDVAELGKRFSEEERIYRFRCVEGWSMVVPWRGIPLGKLLSHAQPTSRAKYVEFISLERPSEMIGQRSLSNFTWPYREGLRIDEAMHPLSLIATGAYGAPLLKQSGAPARLIVPWKYGFKGIKAITRIVLRESLPTGSWNKVSPGEYGFYGNVNPDVAHPRWSQARENRIGEMRKQPSLPFNGYAEQVAHLYAGLDPKTLF